MDTIRLLTSLLLYTLLTFVSTSAFEPNTTYFLNCGATSSVYTSDSRTFRPDSNYLFSAPNSTPLSNSSASSSSSSLYATARVFAESATYGFQLNSSGTHVLRLHFFAFSASGYDLSAAHFNVSALDRFLLLADFSVTTSVSPTIQEYFLWADSSEPLQVTFIPSSSGSFAFVSALEVFTAPTVLIKDDNETEQMDIDQLSSQALQNVYRINVGGLEVTPINDTLWRTWTPDDAYLVDKSFSLKNYTTDQIQYQTAAYQTGVTKEVAPESVYNTARTMDITEYQRKQDGNFNFNVTWSFPVDSGYKYFIRLHFCDFISKDDNDVIHFNVFVGNLSYSDLYSYPLKTYILASPYYVDFSPEAPSSGPMSLNVSIGRSLTSPSEYANAYLNGLEIFKVNNSAGSLNGTYNPHSQSDNKKNGGVSLTVVVSSIVGGVILIGLVIAVLLLLQKRYRSKPVPVKPKETPTSGSPFQGTAYSTSHTSKSATDGAAPSASPRLNFGLQIPFIEIKAATDDFDEKLVIGSGGFGKVYKGVLNDGTKVAVKRGSAGSRQGYPEFQTEIIVLSQIRHRHLVSLVGYCEEQSERILVYEYMEKGPLKDLLYGSRDKPCLSWKQRLEICIGAARGLHYLHTGYSHTIIHRDVKSTNILLGEGYLAKVSDFGLSKLGPSYGESHVTTGVKGTIGYMDPEYYKTQKLTDKSDVYSFGVMLFEVLCARPVIEQGLSREELNLAEWALHWQRRGQLEKIVDARLSGKINKNSLRKFGETAEKCLADYGIDRPAFGDILWNLEYALQLQETEVRREPHEDSGLVESKTPEPVVTRQPTYSSTIVEDDDMTRLGAGQSGGMTASSVFSQLNVHEGR